MLLGLMLAPPVVSAEAAWGPAVALSASKDIAIYPQVALDGQGDATAAWMELPKGAKVYYQARAASLSAAGSAWGPVSILSPPAGVYAAFPQVAADGAGASVMVWEQGGWYLTGAPGPRHPSWVEASFRSSPTGVWQPPVQVSPFGAQADNVEVGIDADGNATAVWQTPGSSGDSEIVAATRAAATGAWSAPTVLATSARELVFPELAVSASSAAAVTWISLLHGALLSPSHTDTVYAAVRTAGGMWARPVRLGVDVEFREQVDASFAQPNPQVAIDAQGDAIVAWQAKAHGTVVTDAARFVAGRGWQKPAPVANTLALTPHVGLDARGDATVVWQGPNDSVVTASKAPGARRWSRPTILAREGPYRPYPEVSVNGSGDAVATWSFANAEAAVRRSPNGKWRRAVTLGAGGVSQVALDARGDAVVVWWKVVRRGYVIEAARYIAPGAAPAERHSARAR